MRVFMGIKTLPKIAGTVLLTTIVFASPSVAITITQAFTANVTSGSFNGTSGIGSFTYDDDLLNPSGLTFLSPVDGLEVSLTFLDQTYSQSDDLEFPNFPSVRFVDGVPVFLDFKIVDESPINIQEPTIAELNIFASLTPNSTGELETTLTVIEQPIPEPFTIAGSFCALGVGTLLKKYHSKTQKNSDQKPQK